MEKKSEKTLENGDSKEKIPRNEDSVCVWGGGPTLQFGLARTEMSQEISARYIKFRKRASKVRDMAKIQASAKSGERMLKIYSTNADDLRTQLGRR